LLTARSTDLALSLTEEAVVTLTLDGDGVTVDPAGQPGEPLEAKVVPEEGRHVLALKAIDRAGNVTNKLWGLIVDYKAPAVTVDGISEEGVWNEQNSATGMFTVGDSFPDELEITARVDGGALILQESQSTSANERAYSFETGTLTEGTHSIELSAEDLGGHVTTWKQGFLVDTSSVFGEKTLGAGAIGADVKQLQRILKIKGAYDGDPHGTSTRRLRTRSRRITVHRGWLAARWSLRRPWTTSWPLSASISRSASSTCMAVVASWLRHTGWPSGCARILPRPVLSASSTRRSTPRGTRPTHPGLWARIRSRRGPGTLWGPDGWA
jgi:hypothetical protein